MALLSTTGARVARSTQQIWCLLGAVGCRTTRRASLHPAAPHPRPLVTTPTRACHTYTTTQKASTLAAALPAPSDACVEEDECGEVVVRVSWTDGRSDVFPSCWLRDNCQCPACYDHLSFTRRLVLDDWLQDDRPTHVQVEGGGVRVRWSSGHDSVFEGRWLAERAFSDTARAGQRTVLALDKQLWGPGFVPDTFDYQDLVNEDSELLRWLVSLETKGLTLVSNTPRQPRATFDIINRAGFVKQTHYGIHYPIRHKTGANSLAFTDNKLGMHNDLPYYTHVPGIIFLHCITQFEGAGGENDIADGFYVAQHLRQHHPEDYRVLASTPVYFWNKGSALEEQETTHFHKLLNIPVIVENQQGQVIRVNNSQLRDSHLDLAPQEVSRWYRALRLYNKVMEQLSIRLKLNHGETLVMDNTRLVHGRTGYQGALGERYMDQAYLDWDEALSTRRVLQERLAHQESL